MPTFWGDATHMPSPDEFDVMVVAAGGWAWEKYGTYGTRNDAMRAVDDMDKARYRMAAIKPQVSELRPFQTHEMFRVWEGWA